MKLEINFYVNGNETTMVVLYQPSVTFENICFKKMKPVRTKLSKTHFEENNIRIVTECCAEICFKERYERIIYLCGSSTLEDPHYTFETKYLQQVKYTLASWCETLKDDSPFIVKYIKENYFSKYKYSSKYEGIKESLRL